MRSVRDRAMSERLREADTIGGERVQCRGFDLLVPVAADMIGAQGIDGDEVHVGGDSCREGFCPHPEIAARKQNSGRANRVIARTA